MENLFNFIKENADIILLYSAGTNLLALFIIFIQSLKVSKLDKRYKNLSMGIEGKNLEEIIHQYYEKINHVDGEMNKVNMQIKNIENQLLGCVQKVGVVRYNAFDDIGGDLSFSMALLDGEYNGFILTSIYNRNNNVVYGKPIKKGRATHTLSVEEHQALDRAKSNSFDEYTKMIS